MTILYPDLKNYNLLIKLEFHFHAIVDFDFNY